MDVLRQDDEDRTATSESCKYHREKYVEAEGGLVITFIKSFILMRLSNVCLIGITKSMIQTLFIVHLYLMGKRAIAPGFLAVDELKGGGRIAGRL